MDDFQKEKLNNYVRSPNLTRTEKLIIILYYNDGMTMNQIGEKLDLPESEVSQIYSSLLARLRTVINPK